MLKMIFYFLFMIKPICIEGCPLKQIPDKRACPAKRVITLDAILRKLWSFERNVNKFIWNIS
jgi:hypothetical protein